MSFCVISPSYKRSAIAKTHKIFHGAVDFYYCVREEEEDLYKPLGIPLLVIPKGLVKNLAETQNWMLDNCPTPQMIKIDDDIDHILFLHKRERVPLIGERLAKQLRIGFDLCQQVGAGLWGINLIADPIGYSINRPLSFHTPCLGPFSGHLIDELRYDENLFLKEDYDFYLQKVKKYGIGLRFDYLSYQCDHQKLAGGCQTYRNEGEERRQNELLRKKWGSDIIRYNERNPESINMRIRLKSLKR
jgi:hypothetical protein